MTISLAKVKWKLQGKENSVSNQTVMVTGISGYLGLHVAKAIL